jgi:hypothetical protein
LYHPSPPSAIGRLSFISSQGTICQCVQRQNRRLRQVLFRGASRRRWPRRPTRRCTTPVPSRHPAEPALPALPRGLQLSLRLPHSQRQARHGHRTHQRPVLPLPRQPSPRALCPHQRVHLRALPSQLQWQRVRHGNLSRPAACRRRRLKVLVWFC